MPMSFDFENLYNALEKGELDNGVRFKHGEFKNFDRLPGFLNALTDPIEGRRPLSPEQAQKCYDLLSAALSGEPDAQEKTGWARYKTAVGEYLSKEPVFEEEFKKTEDGSEPYQRQLSAHSRKDRKNRDDTTETRATGTNPITARRGVFLPAACNETWPLSAEFYTAWGKYVQIDGGLSLNDISTLAGAVNAELPLAERTKTPPSSLSKNAFNGAITRLRTKGMIAPIFSFITAPAKPRGLPRG